MSMWRSESHFPGLTSLLLPHGGPEINLRSSCRAAGTFTHLRFSYPISKKTKLKMVGIQSEFSAQVINLPTQGQFNEFRVLGFLLQECHTSV